MSGTEFIMQSEPDPASVDGKGDPRPELLPEREWRRREVMFLARQVIEYRQSKVGQSKLDQLAEAIGQLDELPSVPDPSLVVRHLREITETHADAPVGELIAEVRRLVDNDDYCTSEHYNPERDRKRVELHLGYPPVDLPATLASVDDVRRVCVEAGLPGKDEEMAEPRWVISSVLTVAWVRHPGGAHLYRPDGSHYATFFTNASGVELYAAIQAARSTS